MPLISIDLVDGKPPVVFSLPLDKAERFQAFMAKYQILQGAVNAAHERLENIVAANQLPMPDDLKVTALKECTESLRDELAPHIDY